MQRSRANDQSRATDSATSDFEGEREISPFDVELHALSGRGSGTMSTGEGERSVGAGLIALHACAGKRFSIKTYRTLVLGLTFLAYAAYHASRRPISVVKPVLHHPKDIEVDGCDVTAASEATPKDTSPEWKPFDGEKGQMRLGNVDLAFLSAYAVGVMGSGHIADQVDPRHFLLIGMLGSGATLFLFSLGYFANIHNISFYIFGQILAGVFQGTGWPIVVAIVAHWFGKGKRGLVMGLWNAHTSVGNTLGALMSASVLMYGWGWAFVLLGVFISAAGILVWSFLVVHPADVGIVEPKMKAHDHEEGDVGEQDAQLGASLPVMDATNAQPRSIGFIRAWSIPGVLPFALALFCSKLVAYTFLFWLPFYVSSICIEGSSLSVENATTLSTLFDLGGIIGGFLAGYLSDLTQSSASVATAFTLSAIPFLYLYNLLGHLSLVLNILLLVVSGICVNGPYALITTAVSADLGSHQSLQGNQRALSTVTAIIDGMGSVGAALGPTITGALLTGKGEGNFDRVFSMLLGSSFVGGLMLSGLVWKEMKAWQERHKFANQQGSSEQETSRLVDPSLPRS